MNGSLPEAERALAEQHISICEGCRLELELVRAIGSQEKPPAVGHDDWTLDRIFGSEGPQGRGASPSESPAPASPPASSVFPSSESTPAVGRVTVSGSAKDQSDADQGSAAASGGANSSEEEEVVAPASWDFEPADAKADVKPPLESLFFATEALTRRKDPEGKRGSNLRAMLWGVGGMIGAVLLAVSSWFVLHMTAPSSEDAAPGVQAPANPSNGGDAPSQDAPGPPPDPGTAAPPVEEAPPDPSDAPDNTAQHSPQPRVSASSTEPPQPPGATRASTPRPTESHTPIRPAPPTNLTSSRSAPPAATRPVLSGKAPSNPGPPRTTQPPASIPKPAPWVPPPDDDASPVTAPEAVKPQARIVVPPPEEKPAPNEAESTNGESAPTPRSGTAPASPSTSKLSAEQAPAADAASPFDRLHLATVAAEEHGDLDQLRRLKASWKSFMSKMGVGPQRASAKREYADCLWAIQSLTGGRADQKSALVAYREYLLGAPAGGADSRSVSRLRQLEDALAERH